MSGQGDALIMPYRDDDCHASHDVEAPPVDSQLS